MSAQSAVAQELVYNSKPGAAPAAVVRVNTPPFNKDSFTRGNETIMINIPSGKRGQYLDPSMSYLKFTLEVEMLKDMGSYAGGFAAATPVIALDGGAHSLISFLEVYHGSNQLEQIREYNALYQLLMDQGEDFDGYTGGRAICEGTTDIPGYSYQGKKTHRNGIVVTDVQMPEADMGAYRTAPKGLVGPMYIRNEYEDCGYDPKQKSNNLNTAHLVGEQARLSMPYDNGDETSDTVGEYNMTLGQKKGVYSAPKHGRKQRFTFCLPLVSGVMGTGMPKYVPVGILNSDLRLELGIPPWEQAFKCVGAAWKDKLLVDPDACWKAGQSRIEDFYNINVTQVEYVADYIELAADVQLAIESQHNGSYFMSYDSYSNFATSLPAGSSNYSQLIGAKVSSMKTIYSVFRDQHMLNSLRGSQVTSRLNPFSTMVPRPEFVTSHRDLGDTQYNEGTGWYFAIGATHYPPTPVRSDPESYYEGCKARHNLQMRHSTGMIVPKEYRISARVDNRIANISGQGGGTADLALSPENWFESTLKGGTYFLGMNFESQAHRSDYANSGVSTLAQNLYLMCRFPNARDDFGEPVILNKGQLAPNSVAGNKLGLDEQKAGTKKIAAHLNKNQFPGALVPLSASKDSAGAAYGAWAQKGNLYDSDNSIAFSGAWAGPTSYNAQQGAMVVDHWVHYDGFMVVEMGEIKTRW